MGKPSTQVSAALGPAVLARLREMTRLPPKGYVAGQAVSSAVHDILGISGGGVYNDIDVFFNHKDHAELAAWWYADAPQSGEWAFKDASAQQFMYASGAGEDGYGHIAFEGVGLYRVRSSYREGLLNLVACEYVYYNERTELQQRLLMGFDLNCVQVGVDLETQELFCSRDFLEFLDTRQLRVSYLHTPNHTAIRFVKKLHELPNTFGDVPQAMALLAWAQGEGHAIEHDPKAPSGQRYVSNPSSTLWTRTDRSFFFADKMREVFHRYEHLLGQYFELVKHPEKPLHGLRPTGALPREFLAELLRVQAFRDEAAKLAASLAFEKHRAALHARVNQMLEAKSFVVSESIRQYGLRYVDGNIAGSEIRMVDRYLAEHDRLPLHRLKTFTEALAAVRMLRRLEKEVGRWVLGCIETGELDLFESYQQDAPLLQEADIRAKCDTLLVEMTRQLTAPRIQPGVMAGCQVRQLVTRAELVNEGSRMHHCVGGYGQSVEREVSLIFSIAGGPNPADCATLELRQRNVSGQMLVRKDSTGSRKYWYQAQLRSLSNSAPPHACQAAARAIVLRLNRDDGTAVAMIGEEIRQFIQQQRRVLQAKVYAHRHAFRRRCLELRTRILGQAQPAVSGGDFDSISDDVPF